MKVKITDKEVFESVYMKKNTFYALKKRNPRLVELLKKGLAAEKILSDEILRDID